jgi:hypothetical protein
MNRLLFLAVLCVACGSSGNGGGGGSGGGGGGGSGGGGGGGAAVEDMAMGPDLANAFMCSTGSGSGPICMGGMQCCVVNSMPSCMGSCPDGGFTAQCRGPQNCQGNPCCVTTTAFVPQSVVCTSHPTDCQPNVNTSGTGMDRGCNVDGDCTSGVTNPSLPDCCTNTMTMQKVCFNKNYLGIVTGWTCP